MTTTSEIIDSYRTYLEVKYSDHFKKYCKRVDNQPESTKAEAILFSILRSTFSDIVIAEDISTGGVDFKCEADDSKFIVEVTSLEAESVVDQSGWKNKVEENGAFNSFSMITHKLRTKASGKADQVSGADMPRILAITTEHSGGNFLLGPHAARTLLTSDTKIKVPINSPEFNAGLATDLKDSVFFRWKDGVVEACRQSISAILLISILSDKCLMVGILHPCPACVFPIQLFPEVPFVRLKKWPPDDHNIETEWVIHSPSMTEFLYRPITFKEDELRNI
jgi:hypothetical protein